MDRNIEDLIRVSNEIGGDPNLVQAGGGNTSVKTADGGMYVKASGTSLGDMREGLGYRLVDLAQCLAILDDPAVASMAPMPRESEAGRRMLASCLDDLPGRPSVETILHAQLGRCVMHTHPAVVNGLLSAREGRQALDELFGDLDPPFLYIQYVDFGYPLAARMRDAIRQYRDEHGRGPQVVFLENHGLFVSTDQMQGALDVTRRIVEKALAAWSERLHRGPRRDVPSFGRREEGELIAEISAALRSAYADTLGAPLLVRFSVAASVRTFMTHRDAEALAAEGTLVPDQDVYCNGPPMWLSAPQEGEDLRQRVVDLIHSQPADPLPPVCMLADGVGLFTVGASPKLLESSLSTMEAVLDILSTAACFGGVRGLSEAALRYLHASEVEAYRRALVAGGEQVSPLAGQVAVVSGAGSGLGRGISIGLARKGMHVVLADIDTEAADETARRISADGGSGSGWPVHVDVTGEESVDGLFQYVSAHLGGADLLVNAAGIAPPYALVDFPLKDWKKALDINLTGYFLMARAAARMLIRQGTGGNIINLSSKTGLDASSNNGAYNATKAGEIHLARGWALELARHGVRVNAVCPGNVFRESKIWNEQYIEVLAKKRGIKPEEVIPYYTNMSALKVPIDWDDIVEAIAFLVGPGASKITGQTLVVDAGQVFVR